MSVEFEFEGLNDDRNFCLIPKLCLGMLLAEKLCFDSGANVV